jgi:choline dehydrogenase-like flavoprotein
LFVDARDVSAGTALTADLCIIGAGAAGITLAREFIGSPIGVAVLESGGLEFDQRTQSLYDGTVTGVPYFPLDVPRLRYFGGSTNHWAGVSRPFDAVDFESREWIPFSGWPFGKQDIDPYYRRAQDVVRLPSVQWDASSWLASDPTPPLPLAGDRIETRIDQIVPPDERSFRELYGDELRTAANVTVYLGANVTEIGTDHTGTAVTSVHVSTLSGNRFTASAGVFVLAVGGIENARLLLASRGRRRRGLGNDNDLVGRFFLEHPRFVAGLIAPADPNLPVGLYRNHVVEDTIITARAAISRETQRAEGLADVQFSFEPVYNEALEEAARSPDVASLKALRDTVARGAAGDLAEHLSNVMSDLMTWHRFTLPGSPLPIPYPDVIGQLARMNPAERRSLLPGLVGDVASFLYTRIEDVPIDSLLVTARFEPIPNPDSRVTLVERRDELGVPRARLDWRLTERDRHNVRRAMEVLGAEVGRAGIGRLRIVHGDSQSGWPADLVGGYHLMGTTRMNDDPTYGVVDRHSRVHGVANLYMAGSSVFPTAGSGNPTLLIVALALRLADRLKDLLT